jgi:hypothetical protein
MENELGPNIAEKNGDWSRGRGAAVEGAGEGLLCAILTMNCVWRCGTSNSRCWSSPRSHVDPETTLQWPNVPL